MLKGLCRIVILSLVLLLSLIGCQSPESNNDVLTKSNDTSTRTYVTVTPTPTEVLSANTRITMSSFAELEEYLIDLKRNKEKFTNVIKQYGEIKTDYYYRLEKVSDSAHIREIILNTALIHSYQFDESEKAEFTNLENEIVFIWYWNYPDSKEFIHNMASQEIEYEEIYDSNGSTSLYCVGRIPTNTECTQWKDSNHYLHWTQGNDCFTCSFPLSYSKEEILDLCKAIKVTID